MVSKFFVEVENLLDQFPVISPDAIQPFLCNYVFRSQKSQLLACDILGRGSGCHILLSVSIRDIQDEYELDFKMHVAESLYRGDMHVSI